MKHKPLTKVLAVVLSVLMIIGISTASISAASSAYQSETHTTFRTTRSSLAPGVEQTINYAYANDGKQMVYYVATADISRDDVELHSSYKDAQCTKFGMDKLTNQMAAADAKYTNPDYEYYNPYFKAVVGTNGDFYNMSTGQPSGAFAMDGVVSSNKANNRPFFAVMEDGTAVCGANNAEWDAAVTAHGKVMEAVGGSQMLVVDGQDVTDSATGSYNTDRHSRTMVGVTADGKVVMTVLDGRQEPFSCGGTMHELAQIMLEQGCVSAINLDGGGSTTYAARPEGESKVKVINRPSDGSERSISSGLLIASTAAPSDTFDHAVLEVENDYVTPGSSVKFSQTGVSPAGTSAEIPANVTYAATLGTVENGVFTSDGTTGAAKIQMLLDGKVVGETTINVVIPDKLVFDSELITVPFGKTVELAMTATYGLNEVVMKPGDVNYTLSDSSVGTIDGFKFTAAAESSSTESAITAVLKFDESITASATINLGRGSEVIYDFEGETQNDQVNFFWRGSSKNYNYVHTPGRCTLASAENGHVHSGENSMRVECDFSAWLEGGYMNARLCMGSGEDKYIDLKGATRIGMWVYIPKEAVALNGRIFLREVTERNEDGSIKSLSNNPYTTITQIDDGGNWNVGFNTQYDESGWHYIYADMPLNRDWCIETSFLDMYINDRDGSEYGYNHFEHKSGNVDMNLFIDDITIDYSSAVDDRDAPVFEKVTWADTSMSDAAVFTRGVTAQTSSNVISFGAVVNENTKKSNYTGLDEKTAKAYVDGVEVPCAIAGGIMSVADVKLADGVHSIKFAICDKQGNLATVVRKINVKANSGISTVKIVPHDPTLDKILLGSLYYVDVVATDVEKVQSVTATFDLNDISVWELDHMDVAKGFEASYVIDDKYEKIATVTITRTGESDATGESALISMPIRTWQLPPTKAIYGHAGQVWMYDKCRQTNELLPIDVKVNVIKGLVTYTDNTSDTFLGDQVQVDTEADKWYYNDTAARATDYYKNFNGGHDHRAETAQYYSAGATNIATPVALPDKAATCTESGYTGRTYCEVCNSIVDWGTPVAPAGHSYEPVDGKLVCSVCGDVHTGTGLVETNGAWYYTVNDALKNGWVMIDDEWYYFDTTSYASVATMNNGKVTFEFEPNGKLVSGQWYNDGTGTQYYYGPDFYRSSMSDQFASWQVIDGKTYSFNKEGYRCYGVCALYESNGKYPIIYNFDSDGVLIGQSTESGVVVTQNGDIYYADAGIAIYAGLVQDTDGSYYYISGADFKAVKNCQKYVTYTNGLLPADTYTFGADGKMVIELKQGIVVEDNGDIRYYKDDVAIYAGLVQDTDGSYYYISGSDLKAVKNCQKYITYTNGLLPAGTYTFGADGKLVMKQGVVVEENGDIRYYKDDVAIYAGLVQDTDGSYYYISGSDLKAVKNCTKYITYTNGLLPAGTYTFGADGKMIIE